MPQYITPTTYEVEVFLGTFASAQAIGAKFRRTQERTEAGQAFSAPVDTWVGPDGRKIEPGAVYVREVIEIEPGVFAPPGPWVFATYSWTAEFAKYKAVAVNRFAKAPAGNPMRTPLGTPLVMQDGTRPTQPATGEPARDPWTGVLTGEVEP